VTEQKLSAPLLVLVGETAVGKTALSLTLAKKFNGEIISADSRLFYKGMDIGTAKPIPAEQAEVPHHLVDVCAPDETLTLGDYQAKAYAIIDDIHRRGKLPLLVGGTGQYVMAVIEGWGIPAVPPQPALRAILEAMPLTELNRWLSVLDPEKYATIDRQNPRRVVRALEVTLVAGRPISVLQRKHPPGYDVALVGLTRSRESLYARIDARVDEMMAAGLLAELEGLRDAGYGRSLPSMSGLGYKQLWAYLAGEMSLAEAVERIKFETHRYARQQANWHKRLHGRIQWFNLDEPEAEQAVLTYVGRWLLADSR